MKRCPRDNKEFTDDRRFCSVCGAALVAEFEAVTLIMPKMNIPKTKFIEKTDETSFKLSICNNAYKLSIEELKILAAEINATCNIAELR